MRLGGVLPCEIIFIKYFVSDNLKYFLHFQRKALGAHCV